MEDFSLLETGRDWSRLACVGVRMASGRLGGRRAAECEGNEQRARASAEGGLGDGRAAEREGNEQRARASAEGGLGDGRAAERAVMSRRLGARRVAGARVRGRPEFVQRRAAWWVCTGACGRPGTGQSRLTYPSVSRGSPGVSTSYVVKGPWAQYSAMHSSRAVASSPASA